MAISIPRGKSDEVIEKIMEVLHDYEREHPSAKIAIYRQNSVSVRVRIIDPGFVGEGKPNRSAKAWKYLGQLPEDQQSDISTVVLLTPEETETSFANFEFEDPSPSEL